MMRKYLKRFMVVCVLMLSLIVTDFDVSIVSAASYNSQARKKLNSASSDCKKVMNTIVVAWDFYVNSDDYEIEGLVDHYASSTGIPKSKVKSIMKRKWNQTDLAGQVACIHVLSINLKIVKIYFTERGTYKKIKKNLNNAKKIIKKMPNGAKKNKFKKYYNAVNKYYRYVKNPTGTYSSLSAKEESLNEKVNDCKESLSW